MPVINGLENSGIIEGIRLLKTKHSNKEKTDNTEKKNKDRFEKTKSIDSKTYGHQLSTKKLKETALAKEEIRIKLLKDTKELLGGIFKENPDFLKEIENGRVPEYFNKENTAKRLLKIYFDHFREGEDRNEFADRAEGLLKQAYGHVQEINGKELPGLVNETRELVFDLLEDFKAGKSIDEIYESLKTERIEETVETKEKLGTSDLK